MKRGAVITVARKTQPTIKQAPYCLFSASISQHHADRHPVRDGLQVVFALVDRVELYLVAPNRRIDIAGNLRIRHGSIRRVVVGISTRSIGCENAANRFECKNILVPGRSPVDCLIAHSPNLAGSRGSSLAVDSPHQL